MHEHVALLVTAVLVHVGIGGGSVVLRAVLSTGVHLRLLFPPVRLC